MPQILAPQHLRTHVWLADGERSIVTCFDKLAASSAATVSLTCNIQRMRQHFSCGT
ncbi:hypothetical protein KPSA3_02129 [Pseudomonas syringae pv. actinidiae]|uniref:Uncharacterized protein n=1 Tax=Pseudomonas syringae pv. actinidiae TaxID=103796 RepID=A0AAN4Q3B5_PSESF|nr:hypothetical protein KPSA3_02129 [Pseudomonas syringae pv. actinidiae]